MEISHVTIGMESDNGYVNLLAAQHLRDAEEFSRRVRWDLRGGLARRGRHRSRVRWLLCIGQAAQLSRSALLLVGFNAWLAGARTTPEVSGELRRSQRLRGGGARRQFGIEGRYQRGGGGASGAPGRSRITGPGGWSKVAADLESRRIGWFDGPRDERAWNTV
ncbi:hypothetical protein IU474_04800 [Nocardia otitidiscaviarum]|uniref:hypothetical protein n=1 Tax=Nocardia otitidiscaviarum TaxID=1823 RepID=UPI0018957863|nr:hypothetical protein [Nocardia otitidiscaviarum]MBF6236397.1 hypothetical protein [Nocardia otitidiscaviarum]